MLVPPSAHVFPGFALDEYEFSSGKMAQVFSKATKEKHSFCYVMIFYLDIA